MGLIVNKAEKGITIIEAVPAMPIYNITYNSFNKFWNTINSFRVAFWLV